METIQEEKPDISHDGSSNKPDNGDREDMTATSDDTKSNAMSAESLAELAQSIIDEMEEKRKNDANLVEEFKKSMDSQVESWMSLIQSSLSNVYKKNNETCQSKIQELYTILNRISQLENEMTAFKQSLKLLCNEVDV